MKNLNSHQALLCALFASLMTAICAFPAFAQDGPETLVVTSVNTRGWSTSDTRPGGTVDFVTDNSAPRGTGALRLQTNGTTAAKAQYMHSTETALADVTDLSYFTRQVSASFSGGLPSYQLAVCLGGFNDPVTTVNPTGCSGFTTLVFEPYENTNQAPVQTGAWQQWDVDAGQMWSSRTYSDGASCSVTNGAGGPPYYTLSGLRSSCPSAVAVGFGVNIGSYNPSYHVEADLVRFNDTIYDFEVYSTPSNMDDCKKGGWSTFNPPGGPFKNQGQCVSSTVPQ